MIEKGEEVEIDTENIRAENNFVSKTFQEHKWFGWEIENEVRSETDGE